MSRFTFRTGLRLEPRRLRCTAAGIIAGARCDDATGCDRWRHSGANRTGCVVVISTLALGCASTLGSLQARPSLVIPSVEAGSSRLSCRRRRFLTGAACGCNCVAGFWLRLSTVAPGSSGSGCLCSGAVWLGSASLRLTIVGCASGSADGFAADSVSRLSWPHRQLHRRLGGNCGCLWFRVWLCIRTL